MGKRILMCCIFSFQVQYNCIKADLDTVDDKTEFLHKYSKGVISSNESAFGVFQTGVIVWHTVYTYQNIPNASWSPEE